MGKARDESPEGGVYHLYARGNDRCLIFRDDADRELYLRLLGQIREKARWKVLAFCLMGNHVHLVVETPEGNLGWGMQWLHGQFARAFNRRHGRSGHLFGERFGSTVIEDDGHLCMALRYVALNPVSAGLCERPEDWAWSSCRATLRGEGSRCLDVERVLASFDWLGGDPAERYADMVEPAPVGEDDDEDEGVATDAATPAPRGEPTVPLKKKRNRTRRRRRGRKKRGPP